MKLAAAILDELYRCVSGRPPSLGKGRHAIRDEPSHEVALERCGVQLAEPVGEAAPTPRAWLDGWLELADAADAARATAAGPTAREFLADARSRLDRQEPLESGMGTR